MADTEKAALLVAINSGNVEAVEALLGANPELVNASLIQVCKQGHLDMVRCCIRRGASTRGADDNGSLSIHWAAQCGREDVVRYLVALDPESVMIPNRMDRVPLWYAVHTGNISLVTFLVECAPETLRMIPCDVKHEFNEATKTYDAQITSEPGPSILAQAIWYLREEDIMGLITRWEVPSDPRLLFNAVGQGWIRLVERFLEGGFLDWIDESGGTVLHMTMQSKQLDIVRLVVAGRTEEWLVRQLSHRDNRGGDIPLQKGLSSTDRGSNADAVEFLLGVMLDLGHSRLRAAILNVDDGGGNLLHRHRTHSMRMLEGLVELIGGTGELWDVLHMYEKYGNLPLHSAILHEFVEGVEYLVWLGSPLVDTKDEHSPLFLAGSVFNEHIIRVLLALGLTVTFPVDGFGPSVVAAFETVVSEEERHAIRYRVYFGRSVLERLLIEC